jgi:hypothetical protein
MRYHFPKSVLILLLLTTGRAGAQLITQAGMQQDPDGGYGDQIKKQTIDLGHGVRFDAVMTSTARGNGTMSVANLKLWVFDAGYDAAGYAGGMPTVDFADIDGDGYKDLIVSGIAEYLSKNDEAKKDEVGEREPFVFIYRFNPTAKRFKLAYRQASFDLEKSGPTWKG